MHEGLPAEDAKESVPVPFGVGDRAVERVEVDGVLLLDIHPAALAAEIARVKNRDVEKRWKIFTAFNAPFELLDRQQALHAEVPKKLCDAALIGRAQRAKDERGQHRLF